MEARAAAMELTRHESILLRVPKTTAPPGSHEGHEAHQQKMNAAVTDSTNARAAEAAVEALAMMVMLVPKSAAVNGLEAWRQGLPCYQSGDVCQN